MKAWVIWFLAAVIVFIIIYRLWYGPEHWVKGFSPQDVKLFLSWLIKPKRKITRKHEKECRRVFENHFGRLFPTVRPSFLKNPFTGKNLELDGYNSELKIAFEYNGLQHYQPSAMFHMGEQEVRYQQLKDQIKMRLCREAGVKLYTIPHTVPYEELEEYIENMLRE